MPNIDDFSVQHRLTKIQAQQLVWFAQQDTAVQRFTHDELRFPDVLSTQAWASERFLVIFHPKEQLEQVAAFIWFAHEACPFSELVAQTTIGVRVYPPYRGKGLALAFCERALLLAKEQGFIAAGEVIWLKVHHENQAGLALYRKLGFQEVQHQDEQILMKMSVGA